MKRTLKKALPVFSMPVQKKLRWKKIAGGISVLADGTKVVKDQIFKATAAEIPQAFKKKFVCLDVQEDAPEPGIKIKLIPVGKNKWDILNEYTGDILNEEPLSAADAKAFLEDGQELPEQLETPMKDVGKLDLPFPESKKDSKEDDEEEYDD